MSPTLAPVGFLRTLGSGPGSCLVIALVSLLVSPRVTSAQVGAETWAFEGYAVGRYGGTENGGAWMAEVVRLDNGTYRMYYGSMSGIKYAESADGISWTVKGVVLQSSSNPSDPEFSVSGPSILKLPDGRYRLYYQSAPQLRPGESPKLHVRSAISSDGVSFTKEGVRIDITSYDGSSPLRLAGHGTYFYASDGTVVGIFSGEFAAEAVGPSDLKMARSRDGLSFGGFTTLYGDWHDPIVMKVNGGYRMYATYLLEKQGTAFSSDGLNWPQSMTDVSFVDANDSALTEANSGVGDIGGVVLPAGDIKLFTNSGNPSNDIVYFKKQPSASIYPLTVTTTGLGTVMSTPGGVTCGADCSETYAGGAIVTLTATPSAGYVFGGWTGDTDCFDGVVTMNWACSCTATFVTRLPTPATRGSLDLNGDGGADVLTYQPAIGDWSMEIGNRAGGFGARRGSWSAGWDVRAADFNGDGLTDFFFYNPTTGAWAKATNTGAFDFTYFTGQWSGGWSPLIVDFDGNLRSDVFLYNTTTGGWFKCFSTGTGTGEFTYYSGQWDAGWELQPTDWDGDGRADLFLFRRTNGLWFRVTNDGGGGFSYDGDTWSPGWSFLIGDFNGDRRSDVFLYDVAGGAWFICLNDGGGFTYTSGMWSGGWATYVGDFDGNKLADLFVYSPTDGTWFECISTGTGAFAYYSGTWSGGWQVFVTDFNADQRSDLLLYDPAGGTWFQAINAGFGAFSYGTGTWPAGQAIVATTTKIP